MLLLPLLAQRAYAQASDPHRKDASIFSDVGQGGHWIDQFFPYNNPKLDGIHAAVGNMLSVYNTGILVFAGILTLWAIVSFVIDSAQSGTIGGKRQTSLFGPLRLVIALSLLVPLNAGYNGAQIVALKLAESGSGLANSIWRKFSPTATSLDFGQSAFAAGNVDVFLQQAMIDESCFAALQFDTTKDAHHGSVTMQAFYPSPDHPGRDEEGTEFPLAMSGSNAGADVIGVAGAIATEAHGIGATARSLRVHFNRDGNDDFCGALNLPVPTVPEHSKLEPEDQMAYAAAYLRIRPELATYTQKLAAAIDGAIKAQTTAKQAPVTINNSSPPPSQAYIPTLPGFPRGASSQQVGNPQPPGAPPTVPPVPTVIEVPKIELPVSAWDALIDKFDGILADATQDLTQRYIDPEIEQGYAENSDTDWVWAGSLFFKLTKLSHDDLRLRYGVVSGSLPNAQILPAEMRSDGVLAQCPNLRADIFLPDFHCRAEGIETTLVIKAAEDVIRGVESQRAGNQQIALEAGPSDNRGSESLSGDLIGIARLDGVVAALANTGKDTTNSKGNEHFDAMFQAVNVGNALYLSASSLFRESSLVSKGNGNGVSSLLLSMFAILLLVPGFLLAMYVPLLPAVRFFLGIATWLITVFEALVALPLIAMVQLRTEGEGVGSHGRQGWFLLLQMLLRPALMIFGLMAGILIFEALYGLITWAIWSALLHVTGDAGQFGTGVEAMLELTGYLFFWSLLVYFAANISFNAITAIPDRILVWVGAANVGAAVTVTAPATAAPQATAVATGGQATAVGGAVSPATLVTGAAGAAQQQIGQSGGPVTSDKGQGVSTASGVHSPTAQQFPVVPEIGPPAVAPSVTVIANAGKTETRILPGKPKAPPRDETDYTPPVKGGDK